MSESRYDLAELIAQHISGRTLDELARDCGGVPSRSRIWQLQSHEMKSWPTPEIIRGLARGLGVAEAAVIYASANSLGFRMEEPSRLTELLPESAARLDDFQVHAVLAVVDAMNRNASGE